MPVGGFVGPQVAVQACSDATWAERAAGVNVPAGGNVRRPSRPTTSVKGDATSAATGTNRVAAPRLLSTDPFTSGMIAHARERVKG